MFALSPVAYRQPGERSRPGHHTCNETSGFTRSLKVSKKGLRVSLAVLTFCSLFKYFLNTVQLKINMPFHPPAKVGFSPLGDLVTPFIHTRGSTPDPSPSLLPTYSLMSPSPAVIRPQKWGIQNWRRESREVPRLSNLGGSRSTPHQPSCSARETGALEDKGTCILMGEREAGVRQTRGTKV